MVRTEGFSCAGSSDWHPRTWSAAGPLHNAWTRREYLPAASSLLKCTQIHGVVLGRGRSSSGVKGADMPYFWATASLLVLTQDRAPGPWYSSDTCAHGVVT
jgi:hypothetical protein